MPALNYQENDAEEIQRIVTKINELLKNLIFTDGEDLVQLKENLKNEYASLGQKFLEICSRNYN